MQRGIPLGRLFGTDIHATVGFFVLLALYFFFYGAENAGEAALFCITVVVSLLVHEFGHVFAVRWLLKEKSFILLWMMGGLCIHPPTRSPGRQIGISLMGPGFETVLLGVAAAVYFLAPLGPGLVRTFFWYMFVINLIWVAFNLLPILPLDGGHALRAALQFKLGEVRSWVVARRVSVFTAAACGVLTYGYGLRFASALCLIFVLENLSGRSGAYH